MASTKYDRDIRTVRRLMTALAICIWAMIPLEVAFKHEWTRFLDAFANTMWTAVCLMLRNQARLQQKERDERRVVGAMVKEILDAAQRNLE